MKSLPYFFLGCIFMTFSCEPKSSKIENQNIAILNKKLDTYFSALTNLGKFNGVLLVSQDENVIIHKAYNLSADGRSSLQVDTTSQFDIHSISKIMAQYLLLKLEQENKIHPQDKLSKFFPDFPRGDEITIQMLIKHQSGLPREYSSFNGKKIELNVEEMLALIQQEPLIFNPGEGLQYSNLGYHLLYAIIGKITEHTFEQYLIDELFIPLSMNNSGSHFYSKQKNLKNLAANHELEGDTIIQVDNILEEESKQARIYSTAADLILFLHALQNNPSSIKIAKDSVIQHAGGSDGIRTYIYADLKTKTNFVFLCNFDGIPMEQTIKDMVRIIEHQPYVIPKALNRQSVNIEPKILKKYEGTFVFADMNNLELLFKASENHLAVFQDNNPAGKLVAENDSTFFENPQDVESFEFKLNAQGHYDLFMGWKGGKLKGVKK